MNILLTNDDGIEAPGLWAAARVLAEMSTLLVVAPSDNYSGFGAALPPASELTYAPYPALEEEIPGSRAFWVNGSPATCAQVGLSGVLNTAPIDLVVSGINAGWNVGRDLVYSGTVGAAITAHIMGVPAIAISLDTATGLLPHWETAASCLAELVRQPLASNSASPLLLNVNVPNRPLAQLQGAEYTGLSSHSCLGLYRIIRSTQERLTLQRHLVDAHEADEAGSDSWAVGQGKVSLTPLRLFGDGLHVMPWQAAPERSSFLFEAVGRNGHSNRNSQRSTELVPTLLAEPAPDGRGWI